MARQGRDPPLAPASDAALFAAAVDAVGEDVVLQKFEASSSRSTERDPPPPPPPSDEELFLRFVGVDVTRAGRGREPDARISLRGASGDAAVRRLRAFLDEAVRAGHHAVLVDVDDASAPAVDAVRDHPAVGGVREVPQRHGGKGARLVRLRS